MGINIIPRGARHWQLHIDQEQEEQADLALICTTRTNAVPDAQ